MTSLEKLVETISDIAHSKDDVAKGLIPQDCRIANIDVTYNPGDATAPVVFEDELVTSGKPYMIAAPGYIPCAGDRVIMMPVGRTYVIAGLLRRKYYRYATWTKVLVTGASTAITAIHTDIKAINDFGSGVFSSAVFTAPFTKKWSFDFVVDNLVTLGTSRAFMAIRATRAAAMDQYGAGSTNEIGRNDRINVGITAALSCSAEGVWLNAGDTVDFAIFHNNGSNQTCTGTLTAMEE